VTFRGPGLAGPVATAAHETDEQIGECGGQRLGEGRRLMAEFPDRRPDRFARVGVGPQTGGQHHRSGREPVGWITRQIGQPLGDQPGESFEVRGGAALEGQRGVDADVAFQDRGGRGGQFAQPGAFGERGGDLPGECGLGGEGLRGVRRCQGRGQRVEPIGPLGVQDGQVDRLAAVEVTQHVRLGQAGAAAQFPEADVGQRVFGQQVSRGRQDGGAPGPHLFGAAGALELRLLDGHDKRLANRARLNSPVVC
jgi:hypothetical protein